MPVEVFVVDSNKFVAVLTANTQKNVTFSLRIASRDSRTILSLYLHSIVQAAAFASL